MGTFTVGTSGSFLPMQPIYQGIISLCLAKGVDFPAEFDVTCTANNWSNESQAIQKMPEKLRLVSDNLGRTIRRQIISCENIPFGKIKFGS